jgi:hypothetical protein
LLTGPASGWSDDLYQASVTVSGQSEDERNTAIRQGLEQVLVKITGIRSVAARQQARGLIEEAAGLVQQYRYDTGGTDMAGDQVEGQVLTVRFDADALQRALNESGLQPWTTNRPTVLLWLGIEHGGQRRFYQPETDLEITTAIDQVVRDRGIKILLPLMDLEDLHRLHAEDLWGGFESRARDASARYGADLVLIGRLRSGAAADWQLLHSASAESWQNHARDLGELTAVGLQETVDRIAASYAPIASYGRTDAVLVQVLGVRDLDSFVRIQNFFSSLDAVENVLPMQVDADQVLFRIRIDGGTEAMARAASLGGLLTTEPLSPEEAQQAGRSPTALPDLSFHLRD